MGSLPTFSENHSKMEEDTDSDSKQSSNSDMEWDSDSNAELWSEIVELSEGDHLLCIELEDVWATQTVSQWLAEAYQKNVNANSDIT